jgi:hypothetical protein
MKHLFLTALAVSTCLFSFASGEWKSYFKNNQAEILYQYSDCHDDVNGIHQQKVLWKFVNLQNAKTQIGFEREQLYKNIKANSSDPKTFSIVLLPNETKEGVCSDKDNVLFIFVKQLNFTSSELGRFELKNISVTTIQ